MPTVEWNVNFSRHIRIVQLLGHCIATWYAMPRSLVRNHLETWLDSNLRLNNTVMSMCILNVHPKVIIHSNALAFVTLLLIG